ncbi:MAG TPA: trehalase family glycosidase [Pyrinomonadaceae bacterium]|jgi:alpha,alpha-trehalase|nr:trehalase family glycosidase [Pyrinomonadaceae bacterium]
MTEKTQVRKVILSITAVLLTLTHTAPVASARQSQRASAAQFQAVRRYIKQSWHTLTRSNAQLANAAVDPKFKRTEGRWPVYVPAREDLGRIEQALRAQMTADDLARIELRRLPADSSQVTEQGLLYLPHPYVVPGGRFNEMYGWDSYFIQVGLVRDGELEPAKDMVENFLYEVENYGRVLNANRTYYLTRSQPPFLTRMILNVYRLRPDRAWLRGTIPAVEKYYRFWTEAPHLTPQTGLSRYYDFGEGPAPEVIADERDAQGRTHYDRVKEFYKTHEVTDYDVSKFYNRATDELTPDFYKGDRSMRESGFDPSNRFGPFSADITSYNPVCLNSLLYVMERDAAEIMRLAGRGRDARAWEARAAQRRERVNRLMWDEREGLYYDYNFEKKEVRRYPFATTFYPLWAGIATSRQAARVASNLSTFERAGGLLTSTNVSGSQWDAPFGWAPLQLIAVEGLRRYGYGAQADRVSANFLSLVLKDFVEHNTIVEKYDVERRTSSLGEGIRFGYSANQIGFGWTNAAFVELYATMSARAKPDVMRLSGVPLPAGRAAAASQ